MIDLKELDKLADLSRIEMSPKEKKEIQKDFESILDYVSEIQKVTTDPVESSKNNSRLPADGQVHPEQATEERLGVLRNVMRKDDNANEEGGYTDKMIKSAPKSKSGYIKVKKIL